MLNVQKGMESSLQIKDCNLGKSMGSSYVVRISELIQVECPYICKGSDGKASAYSAGDLGSILGLERSSGEGNGNPLQYSCLENPMDGGAY